MLGPGAVKPSAGHDFGRQRWTPLLKSAAIAVCVSLAVVISLGACGSKALGRPDTPDTCPAAPPVIDDFNGPAGAPPDPRLWNYLLDAGGEDGQVQAFTNSPRNASLDGNGNLAIVALNEPIDVPGLGHWNYSSAYLDTHGHLDFCYGTVAARIKVPTGHGLRPSFFLLGSDFATVGWPQCGEIDVIESAGRGGSTLHGAGGSAGGAGPQDHLGRGGYELPISAPFDVSTGWHEYTLNWRRDRITVSMDGHDFASWTPASLPAGATWTFNDHPMYVILSMPVGGLGLQPDGSTPFPATMLVDWVRYTPTGP
jgi:beta-glucanase (GH16 family)